MSWDEDPIHRSPVTLFSIRTFAPPGYGQALQIVEKDS